MGIRTLSGAVFVLISVLFFMLRQFVHEYIFYVLLAFFSAVGTFEVSRAVGKGEKGLSFYFNLVFGIILVPVYAVFQIFFELGTTVCFLLTNLLALTFIIISRTKKVNPDEKNLYLSRILAFYYPAIFIIFMCMLNSFYGDFAFISLLLLFVISPLTDTMAYLVGMLYNKIRKGKAKKLCPKLSPKKTVAGAIGGLFGGAIGALLVYLVFRPDLHINNHWLFFSIVGVVGSLLTQIGDLFESFIKRSVGIKDMGSIMPGHGGVMDRIDGMSFCALALYFAFFIITL